MPTIAIHTRTIGASPAQIARLKFEAYRIIADPASPKPRKDLATQFVADHRRQAEPDDGPEAA
jgi:hypothetical protein